MNDKFLGFVLFALLVLTSFLVSADIVRGFGSDPAPAVRCNCPCRPVRCPGSILP